MSTSSLRQGLSKLTTAASAVSLRSSSSSSHTALAFAPAAGSASSSSICRRRLLPLPSSARRSISTRSLSTEATSDSNSSTTSVNDDDASMSNAAEDSLPPSLISHIDPALLPSALKFTNMGKYKTLYEHLSTLPNDGVGTKVRQVRWAARGIDVPYGTEFKGPIPNSKDRKESDHLCYWIVTRARLRWVGGEEEDLSSEGMGETEAEETNDKKKRVHGKVWGRLVWRGVPVTPEGKEERIRGGLKFSWDAAR